MKKYLFIAVLLGIAGVVFILYKVQFSGIQLGKDTDVIRLEDSIIVHGIQMEMDAQVPERGIGPEGRVIYDDTFGDVVERDKEEVAVAPAAPKQGMAEFKRLNAKDPRWHLVGYKIKKNDNLWRIARRFGVGHRTIISINGINDPDMLKPGRQIQVPTTNGVTYHVKKGDTISSIAEKYRINGVKIIAHNHLRGALIRPGQKIFLPDAREISFRKTPSAPMQKKESAGLATDLKSFIWPLKGKITSGFGNRTDPLSGLRRFHCGIDISADQGMPIHAVSNGRVIFSGWKEGYGNVVIVRHSGGYISVYAHNSKNLMQSDQKVARGDTIAYSGSTGAVTGAHLHFELRKYMTPLNPMRIFK